MGVTLVITVMVVAVFSLIGHRLVAGFADHESQVGEVIEMLLTATAVSGTLWFGVLRPLYQRVSEDRSEAEAWQRDLAVAAAHQRFEGQLHRALDMVDTEEQAHRLAHKALVLGLDGHDAELLLADSSEAHLKRVLSAKEDGRARCPVESPFECPAIRLSQTLVFENSEALDACRFLEGRLTGPCSAVCVPVSVGGHSIGVMHATCEPERPPIQEYIGVLESIATQFGSRIGMLRVMSATAVQANTDPLTGLMNRRSFEDQASRFIRQGDPAALAMIDLDHFKELNDTHGHEVGDRALRLFGRVMRSVLRDDDLVARFGGEEFVVMFPELTAEQAAKALRRVQEELVVALAAGTVPGFTASFGVANSNDAGSVEELCQIADRAMFRAKSEGRDRIVVDGSSGHTPGDDHHVRSLETDSTT